MDKYSETKLRIFEAYHKGYITESEKSDFIDILESYTNQGKVEYINNMFDGDKRGYNSKYSQAIRKVDVLKNKLKRKEITQNEFDKEFDKIKGKIEDWQPLSKKGSDIFNDGPRANKNKPTMKPEDFMKKYGKDSSYRKATLDDNTLEKIKHHLDICKTTDDYNEYQNHRRALCNMLGLPKDSTLRVEGFNKKDFVMKGFSKKDDPIIKDAKKLVHSTGADNLKALTPVFRSKNDPEPVLYSDKRTYFYKDKDEGSRMGPLSSGNENKYVYTGNKMKDARIDPELKGDAVYVSSDDKLKVKRIKKSDKK